MSNIVIQNAGFVQRSPLLMPKYIPLTNILMDNLGKQLELKNAWKPQDID